MTADWVCRWLYRRMAWKNDPDLFMDMHPRLVQIIDTVYEPSWPIRDWLDTMVSVAQRKAKIKAIEDVNGYEHGKWDGKYWKYNGNAADIYAEARQRGWTP